MSRTARQANISCAHPQLSVTEQCALLKVARSTFYYQPEPVREAELALMRAIDMIYTKWPFYGTRRMVLELKDVGFVVSAPSGCGTSCGPHGPCRDLPEAEYQRQTRRSQDIPVFVEESGDHAPQPGVVRRHHPGSGPGQALHPHAQGLCLSGGGDGLVQPQGSVLAPVAHHGHGILRRGLARGHGLVWQAGDIQH